MARVDGKQLKKHIHVCHRDIYVAVNGGCQFEMIFMRGVGAGHTSLPMLRVQACQWSVLQGLDWFGFARTDDKKKPTGESAS